MAPQTELIDETGRVVFRGTQSPGGGSQPFKTVYVPISFDTPGLLVPDGLSGGVPIYTPTPGDIMLGDNNGAGAPWSGLIFTEQWDGTNPFLSLRPDVPGADYSQYGGPGISLDQVAVGASDYGTPEVILGWDIASFGFSTGDRVMAVLNDGSGGDPGCSGGAGVIQLLILPASAYL